MSETNEIPAEQKPFAITERWGRLSETGFTAIPNTLIHAQSELKLNPNQIVILLNLIMHWWSPESHPFPRSHTIAKRSGLGLRTVQRELSDLEKRKLIRRIRRDDSVLIDLSNLKQKLEEIAPHYAWRNLKNGQFNIGSTNHTG